MSGDNLIVISEDYASDLEALGSDSDVDEDVPIVQPEPVQPDFHLIDLTDVPSSSSSAEELSLHAFLDQEEDSLSSIVGYSTSPDVSAVDYDSDWSCDSKDCN